MVQSVGFATTTTTMGMARAGARPPDPQEVFSRNDSDGDGTLKADELQTLLDEIAEKMGGDGTTAAELIERLDSDGDGALSSAEFEAGRPEGPPPGPSSYTGEGAPDDATRRFGLNLKA